MTTDTAHKSGWQIFEVIVGLPFLVAIGLQFAIPLSFPPGFLTQTSTPVGVILIAIGVTLVILARRELARYRQPTDPGRPTSQVVTTGVFSTSRNPLYLGGICVLLGIALVAHLSWFFVLLIPALVACHYVLIVPEEKYLSTKFGEEYRAYTASVHRWFGRSRSPNGT